uniref:Uncharacterized protein n=1 Tax=Cyprinus carpio carpio TaxID=630221 RepID=A0A9J8BKY4_CYPCA
MAKSESKVSGLCKIQENGDTVTESAGSGEDSDVLSINAEIDDSDIEGHKVVKAEESAREALAPSSEPKVELQQDIDRSVSEILAPMSGLQQLELLELEMRARAIKVPMKASETHKHTHC